MTFETMNHYVENNLAPDTALYLNQRVDVFSGYFGQDGYFNEDTVKSVMSRFLMNWIESHDANESAMVFTEFPYPGFNNRADIAVVYLTEDGNPIPTKTLFIELKTDFSADSVDSDVNLLDLIAGIGNSPITTGYAFYTVFTGEDAWAQTIDAPTQPNIETIGISVTSP